MNLKLPQLLALAVGGVLLYSAAKNVNAVEVVKALLTGKPLPVASNGDTAVVDENGNPTGGRIDENGSYIPPSPGGLDENGNYVPGTDTQPQPKNPVPGENVPGDFFAPVPSAYSPVSV